MAKPKHIIRVVPTETDADGYHSTCSCGWNVAIHSSPEIHAVLAVALAKIAGLQHAIEVGTTVLPDEYKSKFEEF